MIQSDKHKAIMQAAETFDCQVRRVRVNVVEALRAIECADVTIDLMPGETLCPHCLGTGLRKVETRYSMSRDEPGFPFTHAWFTECGACHYGRMKVCGHCKHTISKGCSGCDCKAANAERVAAEHAREEAKIAKMRRITPAEYEHEQVYHNEEYRLLEDVIREAEDGEDVGHVFACDLTEANIRPDADDVIERLEELAYEQCEDSDHVVTFSDEAKEALQYALDGWFSAHCTVQQLYYPMDVVITMPVAKTEEEE